MKTRILSKCLHTVRQNVMQTGHETQSHGLYLKSIHTDLTGNHALRSSTIVKSADGG